MITRTATETIEIPRDASSESKAQFTKYDVARSCYGSLQAHIAHIEVLGLSSMFELEFCDDGFRMTEKRADPNIIAHHVNHAHGHAIHKARCKTTVAKDWAIE